MSRANIYDFFKQPDGLEEKIQNGCEYLKNGRFDLAENAFKDLLESGGFACEIDTGLICAKFWNNRKSQIKKMANSPDRADFLLAEWEKFKKFLNNIQLYEKGEKRNISAFDSDIILLTGHSILSIVIDDLIAQYQKQASPDVRLLVKMGETFLELKNYKSAIEALEYARVFNKKDTGILVLLADSYYGFGHKKKAMFFFQEAFFLNPKEIPLENIRCGVIKDLIELVKENKFSEVALWVPVFGMITDNFGVSRELSEEEAQELVIEVERLEYEYNKSKKNNILPYLLAKYLYLIDFLENQLNANAEAERLKIKIKQLEPKIYDLYQKNLKI